MQLDESSKGWICDILGLMVPPLILKESPNLRMWLAYAYSLAALWLNVVSTIEHSILFNYRMTNIRGFFNLFAAHHWPIFSDCGWLVVSKQADRMTQS